MAHNDIPIPLDQVYDSITSDVHKAVTISIIKELEQHGFTYSIKRGYGNVFRIFCYLKKGKESFIINTIGKNITPFSIQVRIQNTNTLDHIDTFSRNVQAHIIGGKDCPTDHCCNESGGYAFTYNGRAYRKCHMLCDNFTITNITEEDIVSIMEIVRNEIYHFHQCATRKVSRKANR